MMDMQLLASSVTAIVTPLLPYLLKAGDKAAEEVGKRLAGDTWDGAKSLWAKLWPRLEKKPAALEATNDAAANTNDADAQSALRLQIKKILDSDASFAEEVGHSVNKLERSNVSVVGDRAIGVGGDVADSYIVSGDSNTFGR